MIIKKLETYVVLIKAKQSMNILNEIKKELQLHPEFQNSTIIDIGISANKDYLNEYEDYIAVTVEALKII